MSQYICQKHILKEGQDLENILMGSDEIGYFFENKEGLKVLGYYASKDSKIDSPYSFFYQSFEGEHPEIINCSLILLQKGEDLWVYEKEGLKKTYQNSFAFLLDGER
ncbi:MAG: hypothetical protein NXH75_13180, partial [Halobacteriovoraceae bacterium]|nr:hypothetical protein [Halobacteriovoraceae bacterium]